MTQEAVPERSDLNHCFGQPFFVLFTFLGYPFLASSIKP